MLRRRKRAILRQTCQALGGGSCRLRSLLPFARRPRLGARSAWVMAAHPSQRDHVLVDLGDRTVFTRAEAEALGIDPSTLARRVRAGTLLRVHAGVFIAPTDDPEERWLRTLRAHLLRAGTGAAVSHRAAARLHGLDGISGHPVMLTASPNSAFRSALVVRSGRLRPDDIVTVRGIAVTSVEKTLCDLGGQAGSATLALAVESALRGENRMRPDEWNVELLQRLRSRCDKEPTTRAVRRLARYLNERPPQQRPTGSFAETVLHIALRQLNVQMVPQPTARLIDAGGRSVHTYFPDFLSPTTGVVVEVDGRVGHAEERSRHRDAARDRVLSEVFRVLRFPARVVLDAPDAVAREVSRVIDRSPTITLGAQLRGWALYWDPTDGGTLTATR